MSRLVQCASSPHRVSGFPCLWGLFEVEPVAAFKEGQAQFRSQFASISNLFPYIYLAAWSVRCAMESIWGILCACLACCFDVQIGDSEKRQGRRRRLKTLCRRCVCLWKILCVCCWMIIPSTNPPRALDPKPIQFTNDGKTFLQYGLWKGDSVLYARGCSACFIRPEYRCAQGCSTDMHEAAVQVCARPRYRCALLLGWHIIYAWYILAPGCSTCGALDGTTGRWGRRMGNQELRGRTWPRALEHVK